jgi:hypothetical protein
MIDPQTGTFWASWQDEGEGSIDNVNVAGADAAVDCGRERSDVVWIRL